MAPISLDPDADLTIHVIQRGPVKFRQVEFKVLTAAISASPYWHTFIRYRSGTAGIAANTTHVEDTGITIVAIEIVLRSLHRAYYSNVGKAQASGEQLKSSESVTSGEESSRHKAAAESGVACLPSQAPTNISALDEATVVLLEDPKGVDAHIPRRLWSADIDDVWGVLALLNLEIPHECPGKFGVDWKVVSPWYRVWRRTTFATFNTQADFEKTLFPTFAFKDEEGSRYATKWLCQNTSVGNIAEYSPLVHTQGTQWYLHLHLPREVISRLRVRRSLLRAKVSEEIWSIVRGPRGWLSASGNCCCWVVAQYNYLEALQKAGVLCPELDRKKTIMELVECIKTVEYREPLNPCLKCTNANITQSLQMVIKTASNFDGMNLFGI
ncbi:hypothetical protein Daus18300_014247 [Diaporthe australafricana]|uniref:BTB domain-containing protein n=1 Tax=Diaporthe australafricana TaxID=127596 RepID=A0ABR3VW03_9PEZI